MAGAPFLGRATVDRPAASYCCYGCLSIGESDSRPPSAGRRLDGFTIRLAIGMLIAGQSMIFSLAINIEEQTQREVKLGVQGAILAGTLLVIALLGWPLFRSVFAELRRGRLTIEALFLLTMAGAMRRYSRSSREADRSISR
jgi:cation transport ATPase